MRQVCKIKMTSLSFGMGCEIVIAKFQIRYRPHRFQVDMFLAYVSIIWNDGLVMHRVFNFRRSLPRKGFPSMLLTIRRKNWKQGHITL